MLLYTFLKDLSNSKYLLTKDAWSKEARESSLKERRARAAGEFSETSKINGISMKDFENLVIKRSPRIIKELKAIFKIYGREGLQDLMNPGKLYARVAKRVGRDYAKRHILQFSRYQSIYDSFLSSVKE